jgi:hypothetical protein
MRITLYLLTVIGVSMFSCDSKDLDLPNFDEEAWQQDHDGCAGARLKMKAELIEVKSKLKGMNGDEITAILGKPNKTDLAKRNQKYFIYHMACTNELKETAILSIRFNATGLAYEVIVY